MCAWWYVVIGLAVLIAVSAVCWVVGWNMDIKSCYTVSSFDWEIFGVIGMVVCLISIILEVVVFFPTLVCDLKAKEAVKAFEYQKAYINEVVANADVFENYALTRTLIEQNQWLSEAKASVEMYGVWSAYYYTGVRDLEPITIER